ncbi:MAG: F-type H+-transporting ATPase subunit delta [Myxococcota bacterium]|jgi:F-type H+-transporting ATPase subunit delta
MSGSIARRYARAIIGLCDKDKSHDKVSKDLAKVVKALAENPEVTSALHSPQVSTATKKKVLASVGKSLFVGQVTQNMLFYMADKSRLPHIEAVATDFDRLLNERSGRVQATVVTATPLNPVEKTNLQKALSKASGKEISLEASVDPTLMGGVVARIGDTVLDGSVRNQLDRMKAQLLSAVQQ